jgi:transcriptional regulator with XRE-family HTH domain
VETEGSFTGATPIMVLKSPLSRTSNLSLIESGGRHPSAEILRKLAPAYNVPMKELLEIAGYLDEQETKMSDEEMVEWAFQCVLTDPEYKFGNRLRGDNEFTLEAKRFIVEVYQSTTGKRLI